MRKAEFTGRISACFFFLASLVVLDGLQALMREDFRRIDVALGGQVKISGGMPLEAKTQADLVVTIEGVDGLEFVQLTDFKGYWLGAHMWRATLDASYVTRPGHAVLIIEDMVPAKSTTSGAMITVQNPNLIFEITVWPSAEAMRAADFSLVRRLTGLNAFIWTGLSIVCALGTAAVHMVLVRKAYRVLAKESIFFISGRKETEEGYVAIFWPAGRQDLRAGQPVLLLDPQGVGKRSGVLGECTPVKCLAHFSYDGVVPGHGWLLERFDVPAAHPTSDHEKTLPSPEQAPRIPFI